MLTRARTPTTTAFFGPLSASLLGLAVFVRFPAVLAAGAAVLATLLVPAAGQRMRLGFVLVLAAWMAAAGFYYTTVLAPYFARPLLYIRFLNPLHLSLLAAGAIGVLALIVGTRRPRVAALIRTGLPIGVAAALAAAPCMRISSEHRAERWRRRTRTRCARLPIST